MSTHKLDLIYSQVVTLYVIINNAPRSCTDPMSHKYRTHVIVIVGFVSMGNISQLPSQMGKINISSSAPSGKPSSQTPNDPIPTSKVDSIQSALTKNPQQLGGEKKKNKSKKTLNEKQGTLQT